jgi:hypothetical protein
MTAPSKLRAHFRMNGASRFGIETAVLVALSLKTRFGNLRFVTAETFAFFWFAKPPYAGSSL